MTNATPPAAASARSIASVALRGTSRSARHDEWLRIGGAAETSSASQNVASDVCERSTSTPRRFISPTSSRPRSLRPSQRGASVAESAQAFVFACVNVT